MNPQEAYNVWADQYDTNENKTRDLERLALRATLAPVSFDNCLEIGCGTGKNTEWLVERTRSLTAVDLSEGMLALAKEKLGEGKVNFIQADINGDWDFTDDVFDLITFSLIFQP